MNVRSARFGYAAVAGSMVFSGRFHELYVVMNGLDRPSVNRVRLPAASYPKLVVMGLVGVTGWTSVLNRFR